MSCECFKPTEDNKTKLYLQISKKNNQKSALLEIEILYWNMADNTLNIDMIGNGVDNTDVTNMNQDEQILLQKQVSSARLYKNIARPLLSRGEG